MSSYENDLHDHKNSDLANQEKTLVSEWNAIYDGASQAIEWIEQTRLNAPRLDIEADQLIYRLRRSRNMATNLKKATLNPMSIGFFGLSQAGKSYLISALAAGDDGRLKTELGGKTLDFIDHINPPGGGKEATGLVTRFTRSQTKGNADYPVELHLFSEIEIIKILANAYLYDFNQEKIDYEIDEKRLMALIQRLSQQRSSAIIPGMSGDDVISLWDYMKRHAENSQKKLASYFWPSAIALAPYLTIAQRSELFSVLWGEIPELSASYRQLSQTLARLNYAQTVVAPLSVLVKESEKGDLTQNDSIMNVDMLDRLNGSNDQQVNVCPLQEDQITAPVSLSLAELTALTVELVVSLLDAPRKKLFETVELLDFPGYRGRLGVESMEDVRRAVNSDDANPLSQLILRGKVSYLFERYTDHQEMNVLIVCTASNKQSDVKEVGGVLTEWIHNTQGKDAETRAKRPCGLIWALTMFDMRITQSLPHNEGLLRQSWGSGGMIKMAMLERFGQYPWMNGWAALNQPFNNTFLVRKPRMPVTFITCDSSSHQETALNEALGDQLSLMRSTFIEDESVNQYIRQPSEAWDAMMQLDDGGMTRLANYLETVALKSLKLERIAEQQEALRHDLIDHCLAKWYQAGGEEELTIKREQAEKIVKHLQSKMNIHGALLDYLLPTRRDLHALYLQNDNITTEKSDNTDETKASSLFSEEDTFDLFSDEPIAPVETKTVETKKSYGNEVIFAQKVVAYWVNHLRSLIDNDLLISKLALDRDLFVIFIDELITSLTRLKLDERLMHALAGSESVGVLRDKLAEQQVSRVHNVIGDFITWFNFKDDNVIRPDSRINRGKNIFEAPDQSQVKWCDDGRLSRLPDVPFSYTKYFFADWLIALMQVIIDNSGHSGGRDITIDQNTKLGQIITLMNTSFMES